VTGLIKRNPVPAVLLGLGAVEPISRAGEGEIKNSKSIKQR